MEKTRVALIDAYVRLGCAQADSVLNENKTESPIQSPSTSPTSSLPPSVTPTDVDSTVAEVQKFVELTDAKVLLVDVNYISSCSMDVYKCHQQSSIIIDVSSVSCLFYCTFAYSGPYSIPPFNW